MYLYSDQATAINDRNGTKMRNEVHKLDKSMPKEWHQDPDRRNVAGGKTSGPGDSSDKRRFHNDMSSTQKAAEGLATPANVASHLERAKEVKIVNTGTVIGVSNGFARIRGLDKVIAGEIVEFDEGIIGIVMNLVSKDSVDVLLIGDGLAIKEGSFVKATGKMSEIPLNEGHVGKNELDTPPDGTDIKKRDENQAPPRVRRRKRRTANKQLIEERAKREIESTTVNTGIVLGVAYGLARIQCLDEVVAGEIIEFDEGTIGIALNSDYVILMGDGSMIQENSLVKATGKIAQMPVSEAWLDRFLSALAKPIDVRSELFGSNPQELEEKEMEKTTDWEDESTIIENRESSSFYNPELDRNESVRPKEDEEEEEEEGNEEMSDELEYNGYDSSSSSSPVMAQDFPLSPPRGIKTEKKRGGNATRDFLTSLGIKKKQRQKSVEDIEFQPPPPPPPPSSIQSFFSTKKAKGKRVISIPPPHEQKSMRVASPPATMRRPPLPVKTRTFVEVAAPTSGGESQVTGAESPLHPIPAPPPPPFQMPGWKFAVKGDYVKIASANTSRSVSPERDEVDTPRNSDYGDVTAGSSMFCPSPDVNSKADMFIANFRAGLKLQKMNSMKQKQGVGLSNLGPVSEPNQAKA